MTSPKLTVLIVGLLAPQEKVIAAQFGKRHKLKFHSSTSGIGGMLRDKAKGADVVYIMTKFVHHKTTSTIKANCPTCYYVAGGVTDLLAQLAKLTPESQI